MLKHVLIAGILASFTMGAAAGTIFSAIGATINFGGPGFGNIDDTFNQNGLLTPYSSGVTDFDAYIATAPLHTPDGGEWASNFGGAASVTYDLGVQRTVESLALWNEEEFGITAFDLYYSTDGGTFFLLSPFLSPTNNPPAAPYAPDVFGFAPTALRYVRMDMFACPQAGGTFPVCGVGEVAFEAEGESVTPVPEPGSLALIGLALAGMSLVRGRRARVAAR